MRGIINIIVSVGLLISSGCTHSLKVKNISMYQTQSFETLEKNMRVGISAKTRTAEGKKFVKEIASSLGAYNINATTAVSGNRSQLDAVATIDVDSDYKGSGWNFLINWPGFLIFTPAWNGYVYEIKHDFTVVMTEGKTGKKIDSFNIPVVLDIRHASYNRTWTEIGWLEWGIIPLVAAPFFIRYDKNVTAIAHEKAGDTIAEYIAEEIANRMIAIEQNRRPLSD